MVLGLTIGGAVVILLILVWRIYNSLIKAENQVDEAFSVIDVQLKKRFELIPNLVKLVKGYNDYEANVLSEIVSKRSRVPEDTEKRAELDGSITSQLRAFRVQVENYPDLKSNVQFLKLMDALSTVEDELAMARRYYNGTVRDLNNKMEVFPNVIFAGSFGIQKHAFYEISTEEAQNPEIDLSERT